MSGHDLFCWFLGIFFAGMLVVPSLCILWFFVVTPAIERRQLVKQAQSYGIEYVPGEDLDKLRDRIIAKRDKLL